MSSLDAWIAAIALAALVGALAIMLGVVCGWITGAVCAAAAERED